MWPHHDFFKFTHVFFITSDPIINNQQTGVGNLLQSASPVIQDTHIVGNLLQLTFTPVMQALFLSFVDGLVGRFSL